MPITATLFFFSIESSSRMFLSNWKTLARRWNQSQVETLNSEQSNAIRKQNIEPLDESAWDIQESSIKTPD